MNKILINQVNRYKYEMFLFCTIIMILGFFINIEMLIFGLYLFFLSKDIKFDKFIYSSSFIFAFLLITGVKIGIISLIFFPQAEVLLNTNENLFFWFKEGHVHAIRLLIAYPGFLFSKFYNISLN